MKPFRVCLILFLGMILLAQGCGRKTAEKPMVTVDRNEQIVAQLRSDLAKAAQELGQHKDENNVLAKEVARLKEHITELEAKAAQQPEPAPPAESPDQAAPADEKHEPRNARRAVGR